MQLHTVIQFQLFLSNTNQIQTFIWQTDRTIAVITTLGLSGPGSNGNKGVTPHSPDLQNWNLTIGYNLVSYPKHIV